MRRSGGVSCHRRQPRCCGHEFFCFVSLQSIIYLYFIYVYFATVSLRNYEVRVLGVLDGLERRIQRLSIPVARRHVQRGVHPTRALQGAGQKWPLFRHAQARQRRLQATRAATTPTAAAAAPGTARGGRGQGAAGGTGARFVMSIDDP